MVNLSKQKQIIDFCSNLSAREFKSGEDFELIINISIERDNEQILKELSFDAKYVTGLLKIIRNGELKLDDEYFSKLKIELSDGIERAKLKLLQIINLMDKFYIDILNEKYVNLSQESLKNLFNLLEDLSFVKLYYNDVKKSG